MTTNLVSLSKFLSLVLRHKPETIGLPLDAQGWAEIDELLRLSNQHGKPITRALLERLVAENDKQRFAISEDGQRIRASQGHSLAVDLALAPADPPRWLYHGTASRFVESIRVEGLRAGKRRHVHLSRDVATATQVGQRHGTPVILKVQAEAMAAAGHHFYLSDNGVWLTERVPLEFLQFP